MSGDKIGENPIDHQDVELRGQNILVAETDATPEEHLSLAQSHVTEQVHDLQFQLRHALESLPGIHEDVDTVRELEEIKRELEKVRTSFVARLAEVLEFLVRPKQTQERWKKEKKEKQFETPDHPKVLDRVQALLMDLRKRDMARVFVVNEALFTNLAEVQEILQHAKRKDSTEWGENEQSYERILRGLFYRYTQKKDSESAWKTWNILGQKEKQLFAKDMVGLERSLITSTFGFDRYEGSVEYLFEKKQKFDSYFEPLQQKFADEPILFAELQRTIDQEKSSAFVGTDKFLLDQPREALDHVIEYGKIIQDERKLILAWYSDKTWTQALLHPQWKKLIDVYFDFSKNSYYYSASMKRLYEKISTLIENFTVEECHAAIEKGFQFPDSLDIDRMKARIAVASLPQCTNEQVTSLGESQQVVDFIALVYGKEGVEKLWDNNRLQSLKNFGKKSIDTSLWQFIKTLTPTLRGHLPPIREDSTFQRCLYSIQELSEKVKLVPPQYVEAFFSVVKSHAHDRSFETPLTEDEVKNILEFHTLFPEKHITLQDISEYRKYFSPEKWTLIQKGVSEYKKFEILHTVTSAYQGLQLLEKAGKEEYQEANEVASLFVKNSPLIVKGGDSYSRRDAWTSERKQEDIFSLYKFFEKVQKYFLQDTQLNAEFFQLTPSQIKVVEAGIQGFSETLREGEFMDLPIIEDVCIDIGRGISSKEDTLERFQNLDLEQKHIFLSFRRDFHFNDNSLFELIESGKAEKIKKFQEQCSVKVTHLRLVECLSERPDCIGLFYYILDEMYFDETKTPQVVDKLIELKDLGLPSHYLLPSVDKKKGFNEHTYGDRYIPKFLEWDMSKLVEVAIQASVVNPDLSLRDLIYFNPQEEVSILIDRINFSGCDTTSLMYQHNESPTHEQVKITQERFRVLTELGYQKGSKYLFMDEVSKLPEEIWKLLLTKPDMLKKYFESKSSSDYFPFWALTLPDSITQNEFFWKVGPLYFLGKSPEKAGSCFALIQKLEEAQCLSQNLYEFEPLVDLYIQDATLFEKDMLQTFGISGIKELVSLTPAEREERKNFGQHFIFEGNYTRYFFEYFTESTESEREAVLTLVDHVQKKIEWSNMMDIIKRLKENKYDIESTLTQLDQGERLSGNASSWQRARVESRLPAEKLKLIPEALSDFYYHKNYEENFSIEDAVRLGTLSDEVLLRLESFSVQRENKLYLHLNENLFKVLSHPNFNLIPTGFKNRNFTYELFHQVSPEQAEHILDLLTPDSLEAINTLPDHIRVGLFDAVNLLQDTSLKEELFTLAQDLRALFGDHLTFDLSNLFFLSASSDIQNLKAIKERCFLPFDGQMLQKLKPILKESEKLMIESVLSSMDSQNKIEIPLALKALKKVPLEYRFQTIQGKLSSFDWELMKSKDDLIALGLSDEQIYKLTEKLYYNFGPNFHSIDYSTAKKLLQFKWGYNGDKGGLMYAVLEKGEGNPEEYLQLLLTEHKSDFLTSLGVWFQERHQLPEIIKNSVLVWDHLYEENFSLFLSAIRHSSEAYLTEEKIQNIYHKLFEQKSDKTHSQVRNFFALLRDKGIPFSDEEQAPLVDLYITSSGSLNFLQQKENYYKDPLFDKKQLFEERIDVVTKNWRDDVEKAMTFLEALRISEQLTPKLFSRISEIFIEIQGQKENADEKQKSKIEKIFIESIIFLEPTIKQTFYDPEKLGLLKDKVFEQLTQIFKQFNSKEVDFDSVVALIRRKLQSIKQVFESSDSSESDRRLIFIDIFNLNSCGCPEVAEKKDNREEMIQMVQEDVHSILLASGSKRELKAAKRKLLEVRDNPELVEKIQTEIRIALEIQKRADERNRSLAENIKDTPEQTAEIFLKEGTLTHGTDSNVLELILEDGNLTGELLGSKSKSDYSGALGVDVSKVQNSANKTFERRYSALHNSGYGDVVLLFGDYHSSERPPYFSGVIGADHHLIRTGIASSEITGIVVRNSTREISGLKRTLAKKGNYIPLLDNSGKLLFSPEEFDSMKIFYHTLTEKGYPMTVIDHVYTFYQTNKDLDTKTAVVLGKAVDLLQKDQLHEDMAVLVDFLHTNELNTHGIEWYKKAEFDVIMNSIKKSIKRKKSGNTRNVLFEGGRLNTEDPTSQVTRKKNAFVDTFFDRQLPFTLEGIEEVDAQKQRRIFERSIAGLMYKTKDIKGTIETAKLFSEQKRELVRRLWTEAWSRIEAKSADSLPPADLERIKSKIIPAVTGSVGRDEVVLSSDLDYLLYVDDESEALSIEEVHKLQNFVNTVLAEEMNALLSEKGIRADAGLAKQDRVPFTLLSHLRTFEIDLNADRQKEEPTEILDSQALFEEGKPFIQKAKEGIFHGKTNSEFMQSFIERDLYYDKANYQSYAKSFEDLYKSVAEGNLLNKVKESLQRVLAFKQYHLLIRGINTGAIPREEIGNIPSSLIERMDMLEKYTILSPEEAKTYRELYAITYKLRFVGEIFAPEAQKKTGDKISAKVKNVQYKVENFSYEERVNLIRLLKEFKTDILYK